MPGNSCIRAFLLHNAQRQPGVPVAPRHALLMKSASRGNHDTLDVSDF
jgi:hypothetical protein